MNTRMLSFLMAPVLLGACCSPPDLQANWYAIPSTSTGGAHNRLLLAILNRGEQRVRIVSIEVNPPPDGAVVDVTSDSRGDPAARPWRGNILKGDIRLESGESRVVDLSSREQASGDKVDHRNCHIPVRLRLTVTPPNYLGNDKAAGHPVMLTLRDPMPSALPPGWERDCLSPPSESASAP